MTSILYNLDRIETILKGLGELSNDVIFIGGACTQFYVDEPELLDIRFTKDVDCIFEVISKVKYDILCNVLRQKGFNNVLAENSPIVRWKYKEVIVDILPDDATIVGFGETKWFQLGRPMAWEYTTKIGSKIRLLPLPYYLASKLEASNGRGKGDILSDHDLEDIISIIDGREELVSMAKYDSDVKEFIKKCFSELIANDSFIENLPGLISMDATANERADAVVEKMKSFLNGE